MVTQAQPITHTPFPREEHQNKTPKNTVSPSCSPQTNRAPTKTNPPNIPIATDDTWAAPPVYPLIFGTIELVVGFVALMLRGVVEDIFVTDRVDVVVFRATVVERLP